MNGFLIVAILLLVAVTATLLWPLLRKPRALGAESDSPALRILREQRAEATAEHAAGRLDDAAYAQTLAELEQRALAEHAAPDSLRPLAPAYGWAVGLAVVLPVASLVLYLMLGNPLALDPAQREVQSPQAGMAQIEQMVASLAAKVEADPDNVEGARMLARSYMVLERHAEAVKLLEKLAKKLPDDAQLYADWADALASATDRKLAGEPEKLISKALQLDPDNAKALALHGTLQFERGQYAQAAATWQRILAHAEPGSEFAQQVQAMVGEARERAGLAPTVQPTAAAPDSGLRIRLALSLDAALAAKAAPADPVFVFVRPAAGGPPLAAIRLSVKDLPAELDLAQAVRMNPAPLPEQVVIGARVSKSGQPTAAKGDLEGLSAAVSPAAGSLKLAIDRELP